MQIDQYIGVEDQEELDEAISKGFNKISLNGEQNYNLKNVNMNRLSFTVGASGKVEITIKNCNINELTAISLNYLEIIDSTLQYVSLRFINNFYMDNCEFEESYKKEDFTINCHSCDNIKILNTYLSNGYPKRNTVTAILVHGSIESDIILSNLIINGFNTSIFAENSRLLLKHSNIKNTHQGIRAKGSSLNLDTLSFENVDKYVKLLETNNTCKIERINECPEVTLDNL